MITYKTLRAAKAHFSAGSSSFGAWRPCQATAIAFYTRQFSTEGHSRAVDGICASVRRVYERKEKFRIFHGSTNSMRHAAKGNRMVDSSSSLSHVLKVDMEKKNRDGRAQCAHGPFGGRDLEIWPSSTCGDGVPRYHCWWRIRRNVWRE